MQNDIQKASLWKRIAAGILDAILLAVLATGFGGVLSSLLNYSDYHTQYVSINQRYIDEYGIDVEMTQDKFDLMSQQEQQEYTARVEAADAAIMADAQAQQSFSAVLNLSLIIVTGGILLAMLVLEFVVPMLFGNGQTVGKKAFSLCLVRTDGVKMNGVQHFTRVILGKFAVETMIPVYAVVMLMLNQFNLFMLTFAAALLIAQVVILIVTRNNCLLHDLMAGTVVVDHGSQQIFKSTEDLVAYQKRIAAERAARQTY